MNKNEETESDRVINGDRKCLNCPEIAVKPMLWANTNGENIRVDYCQVCYNTIYRQIWEKWYREIKGR